MGTSRKAEDPKERACARTSTERMKSKDERKKLVADALHGMASRSDTPRSELAAGLLCALTEREEERTNDSSNKMQHNSNDGQIFESNMVNMRSHTSLPATNSAPEASASEHDFTNENSNQNRLKRIRTNSKQASSSRGREPFSEILPRTKAAKATDLKHVSPSPDPGSTRSSMDLDLEAQMEYDSSDSVSSYGSRGSQEVDSTTKHQPSGAAARETAARGWGTLTSNCKTSSTSTGSEHLTPNVCDDEGSFTWQSESSKGDGDVRHSKASRAAGGSHKHVRRSTATAVLYRRNRRKKLREMAWKESEEGGDRDACQSPATSVSAVSDEEVIEETQKLTYLIGREVYKSFGTWGVFKAKVVRVEYIAGVEEPLQLFLSYEDGDEEHMPPRVLKRLLRRDKQDPLIQKYNQQQERKQQKGVNATCSTDKDSKEDSSKGSKGTTVQVQSSKGACKSGASTDKGGGVGSKQGSMDTSACAQADKSVETCASKVDKGHVVAGKAVGAGSAKAVSAPVEKVVGVSSTGSMESVMNGSNGSGTYKSTNSSSINKDVKSNSSNSNRDCNSTSSSSRKRKHHIESSLHGSVDQERGNQDSKQAMCMNESLSAVTREINNSEKRGKVSSAHTKRDTHQNVSDQDQVQSQSSNCNNQACVNTGSKVHVVGSSAQKQDGESRMSTNNNKVHATGSGVHRQYAESTSMSTNKVHATGSGVHRQYAESTSMSINKVHATGSGVHRQYAESTSMSTNKVHTADATKACDEVQHGTMTAYLATLSTVKKKTGRGLPKSDNVKSSDCPAVNVGSSMHGSMSTAPETDKSNRVQHKSGGTSESGKVHVNNATVTASKNKAGGGSNACHAKVIAGHEKEMAGLTKENAESGSRGCDHGGSSSTMSAANKESRKVCDSLVCDESSDNSDFELIEVDEDGDDTPSSAHTCSKTVSSSAQHAPNACSSSVSSSAQHVSNTCSSSVSSCAQHVSNAYSNSVSSSARHDSSAASSWDLSSGRNAPSKPNAPYSEAKIMASLLCKSLEMAAAGTLECEPLSQSFNQQHQSSTQVPPPVPPTSSGKQHKGGVRPRGGGVQGNSRGKGSLEFRTQANGMEVNEVKCGKGGKGEECEGGVGGCGGAKSSKVDGERGKKGKVESVDKVKCKINTGGLEKVKNNKSEGRCNNVRNDDDDDDMKANNAAIGSILTAYAQTINLQRRAMTKAKSIA